MQEQDSWPDGTDAEAGDVYADQAFEDESAAELRESLDPFGGEDAAAFGSIEDTVAALQGEQDERDSLIDDRIPRPWEDETRTHTSLHVAAEMSSELTDYAGKIAALYEAGLPEDMLSAPVTLNMLHGGIVIGALQLAGALTPSIRPHVEKILDLLNETMPTATEEEAALIDSAARTALDQGLVDLRSAGVEVVVIGKDEPDFGAENN